MPPRRAVSPDPRGPAARPPARSLRGPAIRLGAGLLVMGAYGQPALLGSATRSILRDARVSVFCDH